MGAWGAWDSGTWLRGGICEEGIGRERRCGGGGHAISDSEVMGAEDWEWGRSTGLVVEVR